MKNEERKLIEEKRIGIEEGKVEWIVELIGLKKDEIDIFKKGDEKMIGNRRIDVIEDRLMIGIEKKKIFEGLFRRRKMEKESMRGEEEEKRKEGEILWEEKLIEIWRINEGKGIGKGDIGIGDEGLRKGNIKEEEIVDEGNVNEEKKEKIIGKVEEIELIKKRRGKKEEKIGKLVMIVMDGIEIVVEKLLIRKDWIIKDVFFIGILMRERKEGLRNMVGEGYDEVKVMIRWIEKKRIKIGRIVEDLEDYGIEIVEIFVIDNFNEVGGNVEEGFVEKSEIEDENDIVFWLGRDGRKCEDGSGRRKWERKMNY